MAKYLRAMLVATLGLTMLGHELIASAGILMTLGYPYGQVSAEAFSFDPGSSYLNTFWNSTSDGVNQRLIFPNSSQSVSAEVVGTAYEYPPEWNNSGLTYLRYRAYASESLSVASSFDNLSVIASGNIVNENIIDVILDPQGAQVYLGRNHAFGIVKMVFDIIDSTYAFSLSSTGDLNALSPISANTSGTVAPGHYEMAFYFLTPFTFAFNIDPYSPTNGTVPEPGTILLLGPGLIWLFAYGKRSSNRQSSRMRPPI